MRRLGADDIKERVSALVWVGKQGPASAPALVSVLSHRQASMPAKVWAMIGISGLGPSVREAVRAPLRVALSDTSPTVRRTAIKTIVAVQDRSARDAVAAMVADNTLDPSAWFDDDCTVSQTATAALDALDQLGTDP